MVRAALLGATAFAALAAADITISVADDVKPLPLRADAAVTSAADLWARSCPEEAPPRTPYNASLLLSSYTSFGRADNYRAGVFAPGTVYPSSGSVVRGALEAWAQHQHLVLRPDEVWFEVLAQLNFYMGAHAEALRHLFVGFDGKEEITVKEFTWQGVIARFAGEIGKRVRTAWLEAWIKPGFSTSGASDDLTATVLMMGLMKRYFGFSGGIICGLPGVTLLGTREDWARLLAKLDRLPEFGEEPAAYARNLRPIMRRFVRTFDEPAGADVRSFWRQVVRAEHHPTCGVGPIEYSITGWVLGFLHWDEKGQLRVPQRSSSSGGVHERAYVDKDCVTLDGVTYVQQAMDQLPVGYATVPMKMLDFPEQGTDSYALLLAGNVGVARTKGATGHVRARPMSSWFLYGPVEEGYNVTGTLGSYDELDGICKGMAVQKTCPGSHRRGRF